MISRLATLLSIWAAIYGIIGTYYLLLHLRHRAHPEYRAYGLTCLGFSVFSVGAAMAESAPDHAAALQALQLQYAGAFATCGLFVEFVERMAGPVRRPVLMASYAVSALGLLMTIGGLLFEPEASPDQAVPSMTVIGAVVALAATSFAGAGLARMARLRREAADLRPFIWTAGLTVLVAVVDTVLQVLGQGYSLMIHVALLPVLTVSVTLQLRFLRAAEELGARSEELRQSYSDLRDIEEQLVRKEQLAAVGELSAVIAHEVRNPLAIIKNAISSLRRPTLRVADRRVLLGILDEEVDRLNRLVRNLLAYARPVAPRERPIELIPLVEAAIEGALRHHDDPSTLAIELELDGVRPIHGDPDLLQQALTNVVANAVQAMPDGGKLVVRGSEAVEDGYERLRLEFADDGTGMESLVRQKARDPFFTTRASGTGLGLAIVERVVRNHQGRLEIESQVDAGTTVRIVLPRDGVEAAR